MHSRHSLVGYLALGTGALHSTTGLRCVKPVSSRFVVTLEDERFFAGRLLRWHRDLPRCGVLRRCRRRHVKPFVKRNENDAADAEAICGAVEVDWILARA